MKNPLKLLLNWVKKQFRKREIKKRDEIYDDVINKLSPLLQEKQKKQKELIEDIKGNFSKDTGINYGSEFIPTKSKNNLHIMQIIHRKYGEKMRELNVRLTHDLKLECI